MFAVPSRAARIAAVSASALAVGLLSGCGGSSGGPVAAAAAQLTASPPAVAGSSAPSVPVTTSSAPATSSSAPSASGGGAACTALSNAAASAAIGKPTTVKSEGAAPLPGLTICTVTITGEIYPIQLDVNTNNASEAYAVDEQATGGTDLSGVGDKAFSSAIGVETLSGNVDIKVVGPAGPVLSKDYTIPTAVAKAMIAAL